jgi:hypothetical protein
MPEHIDFRPTRNSRQVRTILAASREPLQTALLELVAEPQILITPWDPSSGAKEEVLLDKLRRFAEKPFPDKVKSLKYRLSGGHRPRKGKP